MMKMFSVEFWSYAGERAIKTIAQTAIAFLGSGSVGLFTIDWAGLASVSLGAGLLSILTSVAFKKD
jgi:threonine dehydrogenase-like Zn-dependent dehydrogenase